MNITFLIGNGFDVGMGMESKFKDFFPIYEAKSLNKEDRIKKLSQEIGNDYDTWADFCRASLFSKRCSPQTPLMLNSLRQTIKR